MPDRQIRRGDGHIVTRETQSGTTYQARWWDGPKRRAKTFATEEQAEDHLRTVGRGKRAGTYAGESDLTVGELVTTYIQRGRYRWSTNTVATYTLLCKRQIGPHLGTRRATSLTPAEVQHWLDTLTDAVSPAVVENARTVLSGACREAVRLGILATNPVTGTTAPARDRVHRVTWNDAQVRRVLDTTRDDARLYAMYLVALTTGIRPGELRALMWDDLDIDTGVMTCQRTMTRTDTFRHIVGGTTKTKRVRSIAIPVVTMDALRACRADQRRRRLAADHWHDLGLVFDRGDGNPIAQQTVSNWHRATCNAADVPRCRLHDLRHCFATRALRAGVSVKVVADILGHSSVTTTLDIYSAVDVDMQRSAVEALAERVRTARPTDEESGAR